MNRIHWFRQTLQDVPATNSWLSPGEQQRLDALRIPKRRADWRLGRWTAKQTLSPCLNLDPQDHSALALLEIRAAESGAPEAFIGNETANVALSLSHRDGICICAAGPPEIALGCDVESVEPHSAEFISDYFDSNERSIIANAPDDHRPLLASLMWSAKESALKAVKDGLRADVRSVHVCLEHSTVQGGDWRSLQVATPTCLFRGWWTRNGQCVYTFVADRSFVLLFVNEKCQFPSVRSLASAG